MLDFSTREKLILIVLCNYHNRLPQNTNFSIGLATAYLIDLMKEKKISFDETNNITVSSGFSPEDPVLQKITENYVKNKPISFWINILMDYSAQYKEELLRKLISSNTITEEVKVRFWIFKQKRYTINDMKIVTDFFKSMREVVASKDMSDTQMLSLISLIYSCNLAQVVFGNKMSLLEKRMKNIENKDICCSNIIEGILEVQKLISQFYANYYIPNF